MTEPAFIDAMVESACREYQDSTGTDTCVCAIIHMGVQIGREHEQKAQGRLPERTWTCPKCGRFGLAHKYGKHKPPTGQASAAEWCYGVAQPSGTSGGWLTQ